MDTKKSKNLKNDFYNWCKRNNKQPKSLEEVQDLLITFITENKEKYPEEYAKIQDALKQKTTKALHGAKLNYFKSLKHQCAEDEEVVYYKKGGSVTCGCKKKENGGEVKKNCGGSAIANFKMRKGLNGMEAPTERKTDTKQPKQQKVKIYWTDLDDRKLDSLVTRKEIQKKPLTEQGEKDLKNLREKFKKADNKDQYEVDASEQPSKKCGGKVKKHQEGSVIAKFKALKKGGSLNGIPFMQAGTPKGGIEYNPTEVYNPMVHGVIGPTSYDPMIHGVVGPKETPQLKVEQYRVALYKQKYPKATEQTNGLKVIQRGKELLGNVTALTRVPVNAIKNWWNSTPSKNLNQIAYANRNTNSWDLGQRYLGLKNGGTL